MSVDYAGIAAEVAVAFAEVKQGVIVLSRTVVGHSDPETPWIPGTPVTTPYTLDGIAKGVSAEFIDGTTILATDLEVSAAVFGTTPQAGDTLSIDGKAVTIIKQMPVPAAGVVVMWKWIVRG